MARKSLREHLLGETVRYKKYLHVLRPLLAGRWMCAGDAAMSARWEAIHAFILGELD